LLDDHDLNAIDRYLARAASPEELEALEAWIAADPARRKIVEGLRRSVRADDQAKDIDEQWTGLARRLTHSRLLHATDARRAGASRLLQLPSPSRRLGVVAALVALLALAASIGGRLLLDRAVHPHEEAAREFTTQLGERANIRLLDGTRVILAPGSRMLVSDTPGRASRDVRLQGEAYFDVAHDVTRPFTVNVPDGVVRDLGTAFSVRAYPGDGEADVLVVRGRVALRPVRPQQQAPVDVTIEAGELGRIESTGVVSIVQDADTGAYVGWIHGSLVFRDAPLREALPRLERWYDVEFHVADSTLSNRHLTATFHDESLDQVLDAMALVLSIRVVHSGRSVTLSGSAAP
jgi:transmembrane sensor